MTPRASKFQMPTVLGSALGTLKSPHALAALISLCALVFYTATLLPSVDWAEGARSQLRAYLAQADSTAGGHPVYFYLGHLFVRLGVGDPAWRINLSSAIYGALAIFFFVLTAFEITGMLAGQDRPGNPGPPLAPSLSPPFSLSAWPVALASVTLGVSHVFWFGSTHPRPFSLNMVVLTAAVFLTVRWIRQPRIRLFAALSFVLGLSVGVHVFTAALTPVFAATLAARWRQQGLALSRKGASGVAACYLAGLSPYLFVLLRDLSRIKQPFAVAALALGAPLGGPALEGWSQALWRTAQESLMTLAYSFFPWGIAAGLLGVLCLRRRPLLLFLIGASLAASWILSVFIPPSGEPMRYESTCVLFAFLIAPGWAWILARQPKLAWPGLLAVLLIPPVVYGLLPRLLEQRRNWNSPLQPHSIRYRLNPSGRGDYSARRFGETLLGSLPAQATLLAYYQADASAYPIATFLQRAERQRVDVRIDEMRGYGGPVVLEHLVRLYSEGPIFYLASPNLYQTAGCRVEPLLLHNEFGEVGLSRATCPATPQVESTLPAEDSLWIGRMTLMNSSLRLQMICLDEIWYGRIRLGDGRFYPREARVDTLQVKPGFISFAYAGISFEARITGNLMLGQWRVPAVPEWHGGWEAGRQ